MEAKYSHCRPIECLVPVQPQCDHGRARHTKNSRRPSRQRRSPDESTHHTKEALTCFLHRSSRPTTREICLCNNLPLWVVPTKVAAPERLSLAAYCLPTPTTCKRPPHRRRSYIYLSHRILVCPTTTNHSSLPFQLDSSNCSRSTLLARYYSCQNALQV